MQLTSAHADPGPRARLASFASRALFCGTERLLWIFCFSVFPLHPVGLIPRLFGVGAAGAAEPDSALRRTWLSFLLPCGPRTCDL